MKLGWKNSIGAFAAWLIWYAIAYALLGLRRAFPLNLQYPFLQGAALVAAVY